ncbi:MAG: tetratricopeptide repeat protein, partial [Candidatus Competibacteraceae bacterium]|nr:tetratricopeptide repeat protein [Candidatus Competibacteraceae bacterium]
PRIIIRLKKLLFSHRSPDASSRAEIYRSAREAQQRGQGERAINTLQQLIDRLELQRLKGNRIPPALPEALGVLGDLLLPDQPQRALEPLQRSANLYRELGPAQRGQLAAVQGQLARAHRRLEQFSAAKACAETQLELHRQLRDGPGEVLARDNLAAILVRQQRLDEAEDCYDKALTAASETADPALAGHILQQWGILQRRRNRHQKAITTLSQAVEAFQQAGEKAQEMQTLDLLATTQVQAGQLEEARGGYDRARKLAEGLEDRYHLAVNAQHLGILSLQRAERIANPDIRATLLHQAKDHLQQSLALKLAMDNQAGAEASYFQIGVVHWRLGNLEEAQRYLRRATELAESLNLPKVYKNYSVLAMIARERNDLGAVFHWQAKCDDKVAELKGRRV